MNRTTRRLMPAVALLGVALVSGVATWLLQNDRIDFSSGSTEAASEPEWVYEELTVEEARAFGDFSLFWLGEEFMGHELRLIAREKYDPPPPAPDFVRTDSVGLGYGHCTPRPNSEGSCTLPISIHIDAYCTKPPELIAPGRNLDQQTIRGAPSASLFERTLSIWTEDTHVDIQVADPALSVQQVADALRSFDAAGPQGGESLASVSVSKC